jgi:uncharacterized protein with von Willebrand factor type A (vWA) domain
MGPISRQRMSENSEGLTLCAQQRAVLPNRSRREVKASKRRERINLRVLSHQSQISGTEKLYHFFRTTCRAAKLVIDVSIACSNQLCAVFCKLIAMGLAAGYETR